MSPRSRRRGAADIAMWADAEVPKPPILRGKNPWDPMSAMSHKRTFKCVRTMSALPPKADMPGYFDSRLICCSTTTGSVNVNVEPWPGSDSTQIRPPCISMMRFDMASPKPVPPFLRVIAFGLLKLLKHLA